jgi:hypothetical protein
MFSRSVLVSRLQSGLGVQVHSLVLRSVPAPLRELVDLHRGGQSTSNRRYKDVLLWLTIGNISLERRVSCLFRLTYLLW